ncbi:MAG: PilZ domain-containing protein [Methylobacter sp.]|nr:PilZ domain-containing protein [Methylobacter sp.]
MHNATTEKRRSFRIDDSINLSYRLIDQKTADLGIRNLSNEYSLAATLDVLSQEALRIIQHLNKKDSEIAELFKVLDAKINAVAQTVMFVGSDINAQNCLDVNLSATGLAFYQPTPVEVGQNLAIEMFLPTMLALILVYGKVMNCQQSQPDRFLISVDYTHIKEDDQELLIKHVVRMQWQKLQKKSSNNEQPLA